MTEQQYPTREQIAVDLIEKLRQTQGEPIDLIWQRWQRLFREYDDAVLALFPQPTQECGVCGRQYPADDPRDTCPVCWPGFGEHGQQPTPSAEHAPDCFIHHTGVSQKVCTCRPVPSIASMAPGTTFAAEVRFLVDRHGTPLAHSGFDPSTIRDVTPPPKTPEAN